MTTSKHIRDWRLRTKDRMIEAFGGLCCVCGYSRSRRALEFHHLEAGSKDFNLSRAKSNPQSWSKIVAELRKCVLVCCRCHAEVHDGVAEIPEDAHRFDERFADYRTIEREKKKDSCPICGGEKWVANRTCSYTCAAKLQTRVDWDQINLERMILVDKFPFTKIGEMLGVSPTAVRKRWKKISNGVESSR